MTEEQKAAFHERLNMLMKERGKSPGMLSIQTGVNERTIRNYQKGLFAPGPAILKAIAQAFGVSEEYLTGG